MRILIAVPVFNEERILDENIRILFNFCSKTFNQDRVTIIIADNGSTDKTKDIGEKLATELSGVRYMRTEKRGKGEGIRMAWASESADVYLFLDADLSPDLSVLPVLVGSINDGNDIANGSRFHETSIVDRPFVRKIFSRGYRFLLRFLFGTRVEDAPCGVKAISSPALEKLLPLVRNFSWFFDSEIILRAERMGMNVVELPVIWKEPYALRQRSKVRPVRLSFRYLFSAFRLRRELGPPIRPTAGYESLSALWNSVSRPERMIVSGVALAGAFLSSAAPAAGLFESVRRGVLLAFSGDIAVYLSFITQAKNGVFLLENFSTTEPLPPFLNSVWVAIGLFAKRFSLEPIIAFHVFRVLLIPFFVTVLYLACSYFFTRQIQRLSAFFLLFFGSGLGVFALPILNFFGISTSSAMSTPIDLWVPESNVFFSLLYSPHFIVSWMLLVIGIVGGFFAMDTGKFRHMLFAGVAAILLASFHPYYIFSIIAVLTVAAIARMFTDGFRVGLFAPPLIISLFLSPAIWYFFSLTRPEQNGVWMLQNGVTLTPSLPFVLIGFGVFIPAAFYGWILSRKNATETNITNSNRVMLVSWVITQGTLLYAPVLFQRRFLEGLLFPLAILSVPALASIVSKSIKSFGSVHAITYVFLLSAILFLPSNHAIFSESVAVYRNHELSDQYFLSQQESEAIIYLRDNTSSHAVIMSDAVNGNLILGLAARRVYAGHWANTIALDQKKEEIAHFFGKSTASERRAFLLSHGITHVYVGDRERLYGGDISRTPGLRLIWNNEDIMIYQFDSALPLTK